jgi:GAF domain-containing protein
MDKTDYRLIVEQAKAFIETDPYYVAALSNISALLAESLSDLNWAGFYLMREGRLVVGPFQGKTACIHIEVGKGVCGTAVMKEEVIRVKDVHEFPGHIACDSASNSEIVLPIRNKGRIVGVLDIDSVKIDRFSDADEEGLKMLTDIIGNEVVFEC